MKNFLKEFRDFIATGNLIEIAVGLILAVAVGNVIKAFTEGIVMNIVAAIVGKPDFSAVRLKIRGEGATATYLEFGNVINELITLACIGLVLFFLLKAYNKMKKPADAAAGPTETELLTEIRDLLKKG